MHILGSQSMVEAFSEMLQLQRHHYIGYNNPLEWTHQNQASLQKITY